MGVFEERSAQQPAMHWQQQQHDRYMGPAYDPSRDLSPNLPSCDSSMGDADPGLSASSGGSGTTSGSSSACSTPSNNNNNSTSHHHQSPCPSSCAIVSGAHHNHHHHHLPKLEPLQPPNTPPTPSSNNNNTLGTGADNDSVAVCAGCGLRIADRFYLQAVDRRWHAACLQCCQCRNTLDGEITCFSRDGNIYCKKDYYRIFGMKRCGRCQAAILSSELVMRAREFVFHVHCFSCAVCNCPLTKGDHFGMRDGAVLCRLHFEMSLGSELPRPLPPPNSNLAPMNSGVGVAAPASAYHHHPHHPGAAAQGHYPPPFPSPDFHPGHLPPPTPVENHPPQGKMPPFFNGAPATPRQKGRPRKRKPKDLESMTANIDLNSDYLDMPFGRSPGTPGMGSNQRTKRMRTSFKHHQLRTMKSYFAINHNPDAKDLKQLSQKTGLPKRVLQVWFQNARAKWRRMMLKQEGKSGEKCSGSDGGLGDLDVYPHGPGSMTGSCPSLPPRSPPFMLPPGSPSSLDCA